MPDMRLPKLPDRTLVRHTIAVMPELEQKLRDYAELYKKSYGEEETIETLIPFMLDVFLCGDKAFLKARKSKPTGDSWERNGRSQVSSTQDLEHSVTKKK